MAKRRLTAAQTESAARIKAAHEATKVVVASGKCPHCGAGLRRNLSIAGWWQCEQLGAEGFRKDAAKPSCDWQGFTCREVPCECGTEGTVSESITNR